MSMVWLEILPGLGEELTPGNRVRRRSQVPFTAGCTLRQLFAELAQTDQSIGRFLFDVRTQNLYPHVLLTLNGRLVAVDKALDTALHDGDRVILFPICAGG